MNVSITRSGMLKARLVNVKKVNSSTLRLKNVNAKAIRTGIR